MAGMSDKCDAHLVPPRCISFSSCSSNDVIPPGDGILDDLLFSLDSHPTQNLVVTGTIIGNITMYVGCCVPLFSLCMLAPVLIKLILLLGEYFTNFGDGQI